MFTTVRLYLVAGMALAFVAAIGASYMKGRSDGAAVAETRNMQATISQLRERGLINEQVQGLDDCQLTIELGGVCDEQP